MERNQSAVPGRWFGAPWDIRAGFPTLQNSDKQQVMSPRHVHSPSSATPVSRARRSTRRLLVLGVASNRGGGLLPAAGAQVAARDGGWTCQSLTAKPRLREVPQFAGRRWPTRHPSSWGPSRGRRALLEPRYGHTRLANASAGHAELCRRSRPVFRPTFGDSSRCRPEAAAPA